MKKSDYSKIQEEMNRWNIFGTLTKTPKLSTNGISVYSINGNSKYWVIVGCGPIAFISENEIIYQNSAKQALLLHLGKMEHIRLSVEYKRRFRH